MNESTGKALCSSKQQSLDSTESIHKLKFSHYLFILVMFQTHMSLFVRWNTKGDVRWNDSLSQNGIHCMKKKKRCNESECCPRLSAHNILPNISFCIPYRREKYTHVWNNVCFIVVHFKKNLI